jgi:murein DD-endopeptidase MepM/ murein hydrolase activator NlpD
MIPRARRCRASLLAVVLATALNGCQNAHVRLGEPPAGPREPPPSFANPGEVPGGHVVVRRGETLYDISRRTGAPMRDLIDVNHLQPPYRLAPGTLLAVPRTPPYVVRRGDTLYSIAEAEGVDVYSLARMNELSPPFAVRVGEVLKLPPTIRAPLVAASAPPAAPATPPAAKPAAIATTRLAPVRSTPGATPEPAPQKPEVASVAPPSRASEAPLPAPPPRGGRFIWPVRGRVIGRFGTTPAGTHNDGINIAAPAGTPVRAADAGVVAYAGNELRGYGDLILIKHAGGWMTAYAHNGSMLVHRGEVVKRGQEIATVGRTGIASEPQLHFEIRRGTQAFDPLGYLARRQASAGR